jgi:thiamine kinase-like enzyme
MNKDIKLICKLNKNWQPDKIKVKRAGGQTNRNWIVQHKNKKFFVRFPWERTDIVDRKIEGKNILAIAKCKKLTGVVPKFFLYVFKKRNILSTQQRLDFSDGTMVKDLEKPEIQKVLLKTLYAFHTSGVRFVNVYDVFRDEILKYKNKAKKYPLGKLISKERIKKIEAIEKIIKEKLPFGGRLSTHNDLIFENLRLGKDGKVYLLDFEYAGFNIRNGLHYDLGIILGGNLFYKKPIKLETFKEILKEAKKIYKKDLNDYKIYCGALTNVLVMFWWGMVKYFSCPREEKRYFKDYVLKRAKGIEFLYQIINK